MSEAAEKAFTQQQMDTPHSTQGAFNLPCGFLNEETQEVYVDVEVREITGYEEDMLASDKVDARAKLDILLGNCTSRIGPIDNQAKIKTMVKMLPSGDRVFLLFAIRRVTLGDELPVREQCPACKATTLFTIDLGDLDVQEMPDRKKRIYDTELPSGKKARFRISTGQDEEALAKYRKKNRGDALSQMLLMRLELLDDEQPTLESVKMLGMRDRHALRDAMQKVEGGVDTTLELECPSCGNEWEKELDVGARGFFFPSETPKP